MLTNKFRKCLLRGLPSTHPVNLDRERKQIFTKISRWTPLNSDAKIFVFKPQFNICKKITDFCFVLLLVSRLYQKSQFFWVFLWSSFCSLNLWQSKVNVWQNFCYYWNRIWEDVSFLCQIKLKHNGKRLDKKCYSSPSRFYFLLLGNLRISWNKFWFLLILRQKSNNNYPARKLK